jgi:hypothetical protein
MDRKLLLVSPYIFVVLYIVYILIGVIFFSYVSDTFSMYSMTFVYIGAGLSFYVIGCQFTLPNAKTLYFVLTAALVVFYPYQEYGVSILVLIIPAVAISVLLFVNKIKGEYLVATGIALLILRLLVKGVPLLAPELRTGNVDVPFLTGHIFLLVGTAFLTRKWDTKYIIALFLGGLLLLSVFTYRNVIIQFVIVVFTCLYMFKKINIKHMVVTVLPVFVLIVFIGFMGVQYQSWHLNPWELFVYRPAFTLGFLNMIVDKAGWFGITHGDVWMHFTSTYVIGPMMFGYECSITSTVMGPLIFDGGIIELGVMAFFGAGLNTMYKKALQNSKNIPFYALVLAIFLVGVDVSFIPSLVILFFAGLYMVSDSKRENTSEKE